MKFKPGDVVVIARLQPGCNHCRRYQNAETTITRVAGKGSYINCCDFKLVDEQIYECEGILWAESQLELKRPPADRASWDEVERLTGWRPADVEVSA
jgi:hypothetical protein